MRKLSFAEVKAHLSDVVDQAEHRSPMFQPVPQLEPHRNLCLQTDIAFPAVVAFHR